jgi:hypothetical protein
MNAKALVIGGLAAGSGGAAALLRKVAGDGHHVDRTDRWLVVTVNASSEEVAPGGRLPDPLAEMAARIETRLTPAPGGRGTELAARPLAEVPSGAAGAVARVTGEDPRQDVRRALREAKSLIETGEVLQPDRQTTTRRTLMNLPLELATRRAKGEGVL